MRYSKQVEESDTDRTNSDTQDLVKSIIADVRERGDEAVLTYERRFPNSTRERIRVSDTEIEETIADANAEIRQLIDRVIDRVAAFAEAQLACLCPLEAQFGDGVILGHRLTPISAAGAYIPGGRSLGR